MHSGHIHRGVFCARQLRVRKLSGERSVEMTLPRSGGLLLALGVIVWPACGGGESGTSAGTGAVTKSTPAATASTPTAPPASSPEVSKAGSADTSQKGTLDPGAEYDKGAALAAARRFADAHQVFEEAARLAPTDGSLAAAVAIFRDLAAKHISEDVVQRLFRVTEHANAQRWAEIDPADPSPLINRGMLAARQKHYERAIADYDKAASVAPAMINPHYNKAQALERMDRAKEAAAEYRILLQKAGSLDNDLVRRARQRLAVIEKSPED